MSDVQTRGALVAKAVRDRIQSGALAPGSRVDEVRLANELGLSRTPLREGLRLLEAEGLIQHPPNRSRRVMQVGAHAVCELYRIIGALERAALLTASPPGSDAMADLRRRAAAITASGLTSQERLRRDQGFHAALCALSGNGRLVSLRAQQGAIASLHDGGSARGMVMLKESAEDHKELLRLLEKGKMRPAANLIEEHWLAGAERVTEWLASDGGIG